jgi:hypothetical protein
MSIMATARPAVEELAQQIGTLSPSDRAKLLARLLAQEEGIDDWSAMDQARRQTKGVKASTLTREIDRAVKEVRGARSRSGRQSGR